MNDQLDKKSDTDIRTVNGKPETDEWYCQWCEVWHVGETNCQGQTSREEAKSHV